MENELQVEAKIQARKMGTDQLEGVLDKLQKMQFEEIQEDNKSLIIQQNALKELLFQSEEKTKQLSESLSQALAKLERKTFEGQEEAQESHLLHIEKLKKVIHDKERRIGELQRYEFSFKKVTEINAQYEKESVQQKQCIEELKAHNTSLESTVANMQEHVAQLERAVEHLRGKYEEAKLEAKNLEQDYQDAQGQINEMKQTLVRGLKEAREIKQYYLNLANEKSVAMQKSSHLQEQIKALAEEIKKRDLLLEEFKEKMHQADSEKSRLEKNILSEQEIQQGYLQEIKEQQENIRTLHLQIKEKETSLKHVEEQLTVKETTLLEAQQQFAKKVREAARLVELNEGQSEKLATLQTELAEAKAKSYEASVSLEAKIGQIKGLQDLLESGEKKYFQLQEKMAEVELQNKEFKKLEEKQKQLQLLLANLGAVVGAPTPALSNPIFAVPEQKEQTSAILPPTPKKREGESEKLFKETSLFDQEDSSQKFKKDFFDSL